MSGFQNLDDGQAATRERSGRRRQLAGYLKAANEVRRSYQASYAEKWNADKSAADEDTKGIPGSFPDVAIVSYKDEQLVLFPSYAKHHTKTPPNPDAQMKQRSNAQDTDSETEDSGDAEYWAREWQKYEDDRAVVDVDVRGWIYTPHTGPMSRKTRMMLGLVRQLSGIPAPKAGSRDNSPDSNPNSLTARHKEREKMREEERIAAEAEKILSQGEAEQAAAARGKYSEDPKPAAEMQHVYGDDATQVDPLGPGHLNKRASWTQPADMSPAELLQANTHLMARIKPFLTNPMVSIPVTIFFYDDKQSVSRTVTTNEAGHFILRAALEFVPTHVRVLASEHLSATEEVKITEPKGVSLITDIDDTIKHSSIGSGAREIFRNAFIRDLGDLTIDGVKEWYNTMYDMGVGIHYVSNSPWQLFPILVSFFGQAGLPPGSYHLKQYSGMLQGIFEPVAERKKVTLERILRDFPERKFVLVGDSGEADLEVYTDVVLAHPGRILAIYIRDVTTPEGTGFFDSAMGPLAGSRRLETDALSRNMARHNRDDHDSPEKRPQLPKRPVSEVVPQTSDGPTMGTLIDFGQDDPEPVHKSHRTILPRSMTSDDSILSPDRTPSPESVRKAPPPRPAKPQSLRGNASTTNLPNDLLDKSQKSAPPKPPAPRRATVNRDPPNNLSKKSSSASLRSVDSQQGYMDSARNKIASAYNSLPEVRSHLPYGRNRKESDASSIATVEKAMPQPLHRAGNATAAAAGFVTSKIPSVTNMNDDNFTDSEDEINPSPNLPVNKKLDLWKRRYKRSKDILDAQGVVLRTWRVGQDVCIEAVQLVEKTLREMGVEGYGENGRGKGKTGHGGGEVKVKDVKN